MMTKLGMGMVGGGIDSFIGEVHRMAARLDNKIELVCGALSSTKERSEDSGRQLGLSTARIYTSYSEMLESEAKSSFQPKMDFVSIVTPNHVHFQPAKEALESGFHVMIDKPLTLSLEEAYELRKVVNSSGKFFGVTYTYTGYPMVKEAKQLVAKGLIGSITKVNVDYPQGWLTRNIENENQKQASWRVDPARSGKGGAMGDIGTHAENIIHYTTGLDIDEISASLTSQFDHRTLDDDALLKIRFIGGATGSVRVSQVLAGEENALTISVYGSDGSIHWSHSEPNNLTIKLINEPKKIITAGVEKEYLSEHARRNMRLPSGHPEGFIEAFANIYRNFAMAVQSQGNGQEHDFDVYDFPGVEAGIRGMVFIETAVASSAENGKWKKFDYSI